MLLATKRLSKVAAKSPQWIPHAARMILGEHRTFFFPMDSVASSSLMEKNNTHISLYTLKHALNIFACFTFEFLLSQSLHLYSPPVMGSRQEIATLFAQDDSLNSTYLHLYKWTSLKSSWMQNLHLIVVILITTLSRI